MHSERSNTTNESGDVRSKITFSSLNSVDKLLRSCATGGVAKIESSNGSGSTRGAVALNQCGLDGCDHVREGSPKQNAQTDLDRLEEQVVLK